MQHAWKTEVKKKVKSWSSRLRDKEDTLLNKAIYTNPKFVTKQDARSLYRASESVYFNHNISYPLDYIPFFSPIFAML